MKNYGSKKVTAISISEKIKLLGQFLALKQQKSFSELIEFLILDFGEKFYKENPKHRSYINHIYKQGD